MQHRAEVDGLRALAVIPVILFHAGLGVFPGGFAGVDVFFVISGYLITSLLHADLAAGRFSLAGFYERRARRILPALLLVTAASLPLAWLWMLPADQNSYARSVLAVLGFGSNLLFWREAGYFSAAAEGKPLLHTWSLAVEEQFYLLFPLLVVALWRHLRRHLAAALGLLCLASLAAAQWGTAHAPWAAYYLLPTRAWELGLGALVALRLVASTRGPGPGHAAGPWLAGLGLAMIAAALLLHGRYTPYPGLPALLPTVGTALVLLHAWPGTAVGRLLGSRPLVGIGLVSYSAYLWHQPLLALARHRSIDEPGTARTLALCLAIGVLAAFSWRFVEQPCRDARRVGRRALAIGLGLSMLAIAAAALLLLQRTAGQTAAQLRVTDGRCNHAQGRCYERADALRRVALWGDSHADVLAPALGEALNARGMSLHLEVMQSCPSIPGVQRDEARRLGPRFAADCARHNQRAFDAIRAAGVQDLVLANAFQWYLTGRNADGGAILRDPDRPALPPDQVVAQRLAALVAQAQASGIRVVLVLPHPLLRNFAQVRKAQHLGVDVVPDFDLAGAAAARQVLLSALPPPASAGQPAPLLVDAATLYCGNGGCTPHDADGQPVLHDGAHLSSAQARQLAARIADLVAPPAAGGR